MSKKTSHAENQQERLMMIGWVVGFVDGEGCFSINFVRQPDRKEKNRIRRGYRTGYQISHEFAVTQGKSSLRSLQNLKDFFGIGALYPNKRYDNHKEDLYRYTVRKREDLIRVIIPFFKKNSLQTSKRKKFEIFARCIHDISRNRHLTIEGAIKIARMIQNMNHKKDRSNLIKILRNQTSDKQ
ncbi:MAG: LAGLIDADG family homing endonuclease [Candidatus Omnitrophota bacterium]